ncbi:MAG: DUF5696 domain-containing protein, partial [Acutalibacteraceae bacterium]|nr:DUF5696 domain-containing protein [Acutalibacteraceae bacterium]
MKKNYFKVLSVILITLILFSGCAQKENGKALMKFKTVNETKSEEGIVAENSLYRLIWNDTKKSITLENKNTGECYTTVPDGADLVEKDGMGVHPQVLSDISIDYVDIDGTSIMTSHSYVGAVQDGSVVCEKIKNGCLVTYYFNAEEISVPVNYVLNDDSLSVSIDPQKITENERKIIKVSLNPFMCALKNDSQDSYLFIPSGSGAIAYPETYSMIGHSYSQQVYGYDPTIEKWAEATEEQNVLLPVYGVKDGNKGICTIISGGEENAIIDAISGSTSYGYSSVYASFNIRAYSPMHTSMYGYVLKTTSFDDSVINTICQLDFYPLSGEKANYSGMAELFKEKVLNKKEKADDNAELNLVIYGGIMTERSFFGIPYDSIFAATTLNEARDIIEELSSQTDANINVLLKGFGTSGLDIG